MPTSAELVTLALDLASRDSALLQENQRVSINWEAQTVATSAIAAAIGELAAAVSAGGIMLGDLAAELRAERD